MNEPHTVRLDLPASVEYLALLGACVQEMFSHIQIPDRDRTAYEVRLAASELMTNIVRHGYGGQEGRIQIALIVDRSAGQFIVETRDQTARPFDPARVLEPDIEALDGRGLYLIRQLVDQVTYCDGQGEAWQSSASGPFEQTQPERTSPGPGACWRLIKRLPQKGADKP